MRWGCGRRARPHTADPPLQAVARDAQPRAHALLDAARFHPHARRIDQRHGASSTATTSRGGLQPAAADFNSFYLLGYTSSNSKPDGKYRKIKVTVKRPGVRVRAREGYLAGAPWTTGRASSAAATPGAGASRRTRRSAQLTAALGRLTPARPGVPLVVSAAAGAVAGGTARAIRVIAELDPAIAATPEWAEGGEAQAFVRNAKGDTITTGKATLAKGARTVEIELPVVEGMTGDVKVQVRLSGTGRWRATPTPPTSRSTRCRLAGARRV